MSSFEVSLRRLSGDVTVGANGSVSASQQSSAMAEKSNAAVDPKQIATNAAKSADSDEIGDDKSADDVCHSCKKDWDSLKSKGTPIECSFCENWFCLTCTDIKKGDIGVVQRPDMFFACDQCHFAIKKRGLKTLWKSEQSIEAKIMETVENIIPPVIIDCLAPFKEQVNNSIRESVARSWAETLFGDDYPSLNATATNGPVAQPKVPTLKAAVKTAVVENRQHESRRDNIVIYRAAETHETHGETRQLKDDKLVKDLLQHLKITKKTKQIFRVGPYSNEESKMRPIRVVFGDSETPDEVMKMTYKLAHAPEELRPLSVSYDMNKDERDECRKLVQQAREDTKKSKTHKYKVVGRPGHMKIKTIALES